VTDIVIKKEDGTVMPTLDAGTVVYDNGEIKYRREGDTITLDLKFTLPRQMDEDK